MANARVNAIEVGLSGLYVAGAFRLVDGWIEANGIARWDGTRWFPLGKGVANDEGGYPPAIKDIAVVGDDVYVGGGFQWAGDKRAQHIAKWDGTTWSSLGVGVVVLRREPKGSSR